MGKGANYGSSVCGLCVAVFGVTFLFNVTGSIPARAASTPSSSSPFAARAVPLGFRATEPHFREFWKGSGLDLIRVIDIIPENHTRSLA